MEKIKKTFTCMLLLMFMLGFTGCAIMADSPSLTFLSRELPADSPRIEIVGEMDEESDITTWCLLFLFFGKAKASHEAAIDRLLAKYNADLLVDAELTVTNFGIPYIFMQIRATAKGRPARFVSGGAL